VRGNLNLLPELSATFDLGVIHQTSHMRLRSTTFAHGKTNSIEVVRPARRRSSMPSRRDPVSWNSVGNRSGRFPARTGWRRGRCSTRRTWRRVDNRCSCRRRISAQGGRQLRRSPGWTFGLFDVYSGLVPGFAAGQSEAFRAPSSNGQSSGSVLSDISVPGPKEPPCRPRRQPRQRAIWEPAWATARWPPCHFKRGRTIYYGIEFSLRRD